MAGTIRKIIKRVPKSLERVCTALILHAGHLNGPDLFPANSNHLIVFESRQICQTPFPHLCDIP